MKIVNMQTNCDSNEPRPEYLQLLTVLMVM